MFEDGLTVEQVAAKFAAMVSTRQQVGLSKS
jgi:hypothetical protein